MLEKILQRPLLVYLIAVMIAVGGIFSVFVLPIKLQPHVNAPFLFVSAGVDQDINISEMEKKVTLPLESVARNDENVKDVYATTTTKNVQMEIWLRDSVTEDEMNQLEEELNQQLNSVAIDLDYSSVTQYSSSDNVILMMAVTSDASDQSLVQREWQDVILPQLSNVPGVRKVDHPFDHFNMNYILEIKSDKMKSLQQLSNIIDELHNSFASPLLGVLKYNGEQYQVRSDSDIHYEEELLRYRFQNGEQLSDLAVIRTDRQADHYYTMLDGKPYYEISLYASESASEVQISKNVRALMDSLYENQSTTWEIVYIWDAANFIGKAINGLVLNILIGAAVAAVVLYFVFRNVRTMLIVAMSMPICILTTFIAMYLNGISLNIITLFGIGLGTGMIVDACIVVIENIFRKMQEGLERKEAVIKGTKEVLAPVTSSVLTTVSVFAPISFLEGMIGVLMKELALTVTVALISSLLVATILIPILSYKIAFIEEKKTLLKVTLYEKMLSFSLKHKMLVLFSFIVLFIGSLYTLISFVPKSFMPTITDRTLFINYTLDEHVDYEKAYAWSHSTAAKLKQVDGVKNVIYYGNESNSDRGGFYILYNPVHEMPKSDAEVQAEIAAIFEQEIPYKSISIGAGQADTSGKMQISVIGSSMNSIIHSLPHIREEIEWIPGVTGTEAYLAEGSQNWVIRFSKEQLTRYGISRQEIENYLRMVLNGVHPLELEINGEEREVRIEFPQMYRQQSDALYQLPIRSDLHLTVDDVAELSTVVTEAQRVRKNGQYQTTLTIYFNPEQRGQVIEQVSQLVSQYPQGDVILQLAGTQQQQAEGFQDLLFALGVSFSTVFLILAVQFNRLRQPFLIMLSLPFTMIGVTAGFFITGRTFDILAMIGIVMLVGIVVNNAIVLIDFLNKHRDKYEDFHTAVVQAAKLRLRPIMTTTATTIGGLIPMFIGGSEASDFQTPLATSVIFGLMFSTFTSLILVPVLYVMFEGRGRKHNQKHIEHVPSDETSSKRRLLRRFGRGKSSVVKT